MFAQLIGREATTGGSHCFRRSAKSRKEVGSVEFKIKDQSSVWRASVLRHVDYLVETLSAMCERAAGRGDPELVDLNRALTRAIRIRNSIRRRSEKRRVWPFVRSVLQDLLVMYEVARTIHSLLFNCPYIRQWSRSTCCIFQSISPNAQAEISEYPRSLALV